VTPTETSVLIAACGGSASKPTLIAMGCSRADILAALESGVCAELRRGILAHPARSKCDFGPKSKAVMSAYFFTKRPISDDNAYKRTLRFLEDIKLTRCNFHKICEKLIARGLIYRNGRLKCVTKTARVSIF
jgi:hypothetical protein